MGVLGASLGGSVFWNFLIREPEVPFLVPPKWLKRPQFGEKPHKRYLQSAKNIAKKGKNLSLKIRLHQDKFLHNFGLQILSNSTSTFCRRRN